MNLSELYARVEYDISRPTSRFKSIETDEAWHSKVATLLLLPFTNNKYQAYQERVRKIAFIPLADGTWTSIAAGSVFLPEAGGMTIPTDLPMRIIDEQATQNPERRKLFEAIGVAEASTTSVRDSIQKAHQRMVAKHLPLETALHHLKYLYWTHNKDSERCLGTSALLPYWWCLIYDSNGNRLSRVWEIYLQSSRKFDIEELLKPVPSDKKVFSVHFLHPDYCKSVRCPRIKNTDIHHGIHG